jgi:hypothetical protein
MNSYFALQPCYYTQEGIRLAFINFCNRTGRRYDEQPFFDAGYDKFGFGYWLEPNNERAIAQADSLADIVIAFPHSGEEYYTEPPEPRGGGAVSRPLEIENCPPYIPFAEAPDFKFRIWPGMSDRLMRYHAVDMGADAVLNAHPHVLQGFEVYNGVLIAHSLGNFMFDLYYPETMSTMVLRARFDKEGILSWTFKPAFVDRWIPRPASGRLGREILDRMADYSRQLGTSVGVNPQCMLGKIFLDPEDAVPVVTESDGSQSLRDGGDFYVSLPIELAGEGSLSQILDAQGVVPEESQVRVGREVLWFGGFEYDEGHSMWSLNSDDEWLDDTVYYEGGHSLILHRNEHAGDNVVTLLSRHLPAADSVFYSLWGWMKTEDAAGAKFSLRFYNSRYSWHPIDTYDMGPPIDGTTDWTCYAQDFWAPTETEFFNVRCNLDVPHDGDAYAWFDDLRVIEWEPWQELVLPLDVAYPNNLRFVQVRTPYAADSARVFYREIALTDGEFSRVNDYEPGRAINVLLAGAAPNPCRGETTIRYRLSGRARVSLEIFDISGRMISRLAQDELQRPGWHKVPWIAHGMPAGVYFSRLTVDGEAFARKMVVLR